ncbi:hypothetical protein [Glacieibacterium frigidum]|uniref:Lipoprotein n=1 Tax=Glacieibacterium frigidum TaxID=2593303 RepID=A0A552UGA5_9SPHN|nr:hypothetical protein [Glacieibacterium frigidum]TRW17250.1 hypothetical protein FMM06_03400 [Glacieibacterium frigidum]
MIRALLLLPFLALAACGTNETAAAKPEQVAADAAGAAYAACVDKAAAAVDLSADQPAALTDRALKACINQRTALVEAVKLAGTSGGVDPMTARLVAERSVRLADSELRERANTAIVRAKLKAS